MRIEIIGNGYVRIPPDPPILCIMKYLYDWF